MGIAIGAGLLAGGALLGYAAESQKKTAYNTANDYNAQQIADQRARLAGLTYGNQGGLDYGALTGTDPAARARFFAQNPSYMDAMRGLTGDVQAGYGGPQGLISKFEADQSDLARTQDAVRRRLVGQAQGYGQNLDRMGQNVEAGTRSWGAGRGDVIRGDFARQTQSALDANEQGMTARGLGNTTIRNQAAGGIRAGMATEQNRALSDLANQQQDRVGAAQQFRAGLTNQTQQGIMGLDQGYSSQGLNAAYQRAGQRLGLQQQALGANTGLRQQMASFPLQYMAGMPANPMIQPFGHAGEALGSMANSFSSLGSLGMGQAIGGMGGGGGAPAGQGGGDPNYYYQRMWGG